MCKFQELTNSFNYDSAMLAVRNNRWLVPQEQWDTYNLLTDGYLESFRHCQTALKTWALFSGFSAEERYKESFIESKKELSKIVEQLNIYFDEYVNI